jgi:RHS repeat-associated protein
LGSLATTHGYNAFGELQSIAVTHGSNTLYTIGYTLDKLGRIITKTETLAGATTTEGFGHDDAGRLSSATRNGQTAIYGYDANGNRIFSNGITAQYDAQDRLLVYGANTYAYTDNGELKSKTNGALTTTFTYDVLGNMTHVTLPDGVSIDYLVDGRNRRIGKKINGTLVQGFLYQDQIKPVAELDGAGGIVSRFVYGTRPNVPEYLIKGTQMYRIVTDHLGSPRLVVNVSDGSIVQRIDYDEWGNVINDTNPSFQPFGFAGGLYDQHTKLVRFGARDYDPETGRWTTKDPARFGGGDSNLYAYVHNAPHMYTDPYGLEVLVCSQPAFGSMPVDHQWIKTDAVEAGMGGTRGNVPGNQSGDKPYDPVQVTDHSGRSKQKGSSCKKVENVDEQKVNDQLKIGKPLGRWSPTNQCQSFVREVLNNASTLPPPPEPQFDFVP